MGKIDEYWDKIHLQYTSSYDGWLDKYLSFFKPNGKVVELGCGRAYCSKYLLEQGYKNIIVCDISQEVLRIVNNEEPKLKTMLFDMSEGLPFQDNSIDVIVADLSLHYFDHDTTLYIFDEIYRVLNDNGILVGRVNATTDKLNIPKNAIEVEKNFYYDGNIYKRFFEENDFPILFRKFEIKDLIQENMSRYDWPKVLWKFCLKK